MLAAKDQLHVRQAFGKPLVEQQYLQYKMAELSTQLVTSRVMVRHAAAAIDNKELVTKYPEAGNLLQQFFNDISSSRSNSS